MDVGVRADTTRLVRGSVGFRPETEEAPLVLAEEVLLPVEVTLEP